MWGAPRCAATRRNGRVKHLRRAVLPPLIVLIVLVITTEVWVRLTNKPAYLVPRPTMVWTAIVENRVELWGSLLTTARGALIGFAASVVGGVLIAVVLSTSRVIQRAFYPYTVFFQTVP